MKKFRASLLLLALTQWVTAPIQAAIVLPGGGSGGAGGASVGYSCPATAASSGTVIVPNGVPTVVKSTNYSIVPADCGTQFETTATMTFTLPPFTGGGSVANGFGFILFNKGAGTVTASASVGNIYNGSTGTSLTIAGGQMVGFSVNAAGNGWNATPAAGPAGPAGPAGAAGLTGPGYKAGVWFTPWLWFSQSVAGSTINTNNTSCASLYIPNILPAGGGTGTLGSMDLGTVLAGGAGGTVQMALYTDDATPAVAGANRPGSFLGSSNQVADTVTNAPVIVTFTPGVSLSANTTYWGCIQASDTTYKYRSQPGANGSISFHSMITGTTGTTNGTSGALTNSVFTSTGVTSYGVWPSTLHGATFTDNNSSTFNAGPWFSMQFSSIP